ncbi:probable LRR receptor-like serine/threonine-protein kinase At1g74360 [Typha latifolia]|uniref:probable LRR receptor-like serine/threonine-protein kinase At1g74360 n=1 Tax=Typha latifolia TaxID=4733 RepID=UPI003C2E2F18
MFVGLSNLTELESLDLSENTIDGCLPKDLNECGGLRYLNISHNLLGGELNLTGLVNLRVVDLTSNRFEGEIRGKFQAMCANLVLLNISANNFTGEITGSFDECPNLQYLDLSTNKFTGEIWKGFAKLREFSMADNNLTGEILSETFPSNCSLEFLDLSSNKLAGELPDSVANCSKLEHLNLWNNSFSGAIPSGIGELAKLQRLFLGSNGFHRNISEKLLNCKELIFLDLTKNNFGREIQGIFGRFVKLQFLLLHGNYYTGGIQSSGVLKLPDLFTLDLSFNNFSGELPVEIAAMPKIKFLVLAYNNFSGSIPPEFGSIVGLQALDLSYNRLTGRIPPELGKLKSLLWLTLANNLLSGEIPPEIGNCSSLLWLNLAANRISGRIPSEITRVGKDPSPTFQANRRDFIVGGLSGECLSMKRWIPVNYPPFSFIYTLLTPKSCQTTWDRILKGYGIIPICTNSTSQMRTLAISGYLQLTGNLLSGEVPPEIGNMQFISLLHLDDNQLSGSLPAEIAYLPLVVLNVSRNLFSGQIPSKIGSLRCLNNLDLSWNNFSGEFPMSLNQLSELSKFNISYNPLLSGVVPDTGQMATFDNDSFIGDSLISFSSHHPSPPSTSSSLAVRHGTWWRMVLFWLFIALTATFLACGVISFILCLRIRTPVDHNMDSDPYPDEFLLDITKRRSDEVGSSPSTSATSSLTSLDEVKIFRLDKTAFTYRDIVTATENFSEALIIGRGGYSTVYRGVLPDGRLVAVKKLETLGVGGEKEFMAEMEVLAGQTGSGWPHPNLVHLYGWCISGSVKLLVYEYMEGGSVEEVLEDWVQFGCVERLGTAVGVARALAFLHHVCEPAVVHRDVKASNVLLDGDGRPRVTDFGLARTVEDGESHVSTVVAGTVGYVAPEYGQTWRATTKGDVYSFGVLAMELATGRRAVDGGEECLVEWGRRVAMEEGHMEGFDGRAEMWGLLKVGIRCTAELPGNRPDIRDVLQMLLHIHEGSSNQR